jgi:hypothetical protein
MTCDRNCPIHLHQAADDCYWVTADKGCRLKAEHDKRRKQSEDDHRIAANMRDYWIHHADGADR